MLKTQQDVEMKDEREFSMETIKKKVKRELGYDSDLIIDKDDQEMLNSIA